MDNDFFGSGDGGDPVLFQHLLWFFGHPSTWLTLLLWVVLMTAVVKIAKRLWRLQKPLRFVLFIVIVGTCLTYYIWLSVDAYALYVEGRAVELTMLSHAKIVFLALSILSAGWIAFDWLKARRSD